MSKNSVIEAKAESKSLAQAEPTPAQGGMGGSQETEVPVNTRSYIRGGLLFLLATLGIFSAWAALAPLSSAIVAQGEVVVENYRRTIQHLEGGIIEEIHVRNGDFVEKGDPLIQLQTTQWQAEREITRKRLFSTLAQLERLRREQAIIEQLNDLQLPESSRVPPLLYSEPLLLAMQQDEDVRQVANQQQQLFQARISAFVQQQQSLAKRIDQIRQQVSGMEDQLAITREQLAATEEEQQAFATLFEEGLADGQRARDLRRTLLNQRNEAAGLRSEIARLELQATETQLQLTANRQDFLKEIGERLKENQSEYFDLQERLLVANDAFNRATIKAPDAGIVIDMQVHTLGSVASPGTTLLELVPEKEAYIVEARVEPKDIDDLYRGQLADIRFSAFNQRLTPIIEAEVANISADRLKDEQQNTSYYLVRLQMTEKGRSDMTEDMRLKPGMPAEVMIKRGERTLFSYLLKPITDALARSLTEG